MYEIYRIYSIEYGEIILFLALCAPLNMTRGNTAMKYSRSSIMMSSLMLYTPRINFNRPVNRRVIVTTVNLFTLVYDSRYNLYYSTIPSEIAPPGRETSFSSMNRDSFCCARTEHACISIGNSYFRRIGRTTVSSDAKLFPRDTERSSYTM